MPEKTLRADLVACKVMQVGSLLPLALILPILSAGPLDGSLAGSLLEGCGASIAAEPEPSTNSESKAGVVSLKNHDYKAAQDIFEDEVEKHPGTASCHIGLAEALNGLGKYERAFDESGRALAIEPNSRAALNARASANIGLHKFKDAQKDCEAVVAVDPRNVDALCLKAKAEAGTERYREALADVNKALGVQPKNASALSVRARICVGLEQYDRAIADCNKAIEIDARLAGAYRSRGQSYKALGKKSLANADFKRAKDLGYQE
ncbi:MAG TPA: tetratricopeptide repeat protein [Oculatellaceae cyanobacterium]